MTLSQQINHMNKLTLQAPQNSTKIVYSASGTMISAAVLSDARVIIEHGAYWTAARNPDEARYVAAVLNSRRVLVRIVPLQPVGQNGPRHFDNLVWELPIPDFDPREALHTDLAALAAEAEAVAASVPLDEQAHFTAQRSTIREAIAAAGLTARIDALVLRLLDG